MQPAVFSNGFILKHFESSALYHSAAVLIEVLVNIERPPTHYQTIGLEVSLVILLIIKLIIHLEKANLSQLIPNP